MGLRVLVLQVTNCTGAPTHLQGYPGVQLRDEDDAVIAVTTTHGLTGGIVDPGPVPLVLAPGAAARAGLSWRDRVTDGAAQTGERLVITPDPSREHGGRTPDSAAGEVLHEVVDVGTTATIDVTAWEPAP